MKRPGSPPSLEPKRAKITTFTPRLTRIPTQNIDELFKSKKPDESKCISGYVKMLWPATKDSIKKRALVALGEDFNTKSIQLKLASPNEEHLKSLTIRHKDRFRLSLRGAHLAILSHIPKLSTHPYCLELLNGFHIEWIHLNDDGTEDGFSVNCWAEEDVDEPPQEVSKPGRTLSDGWYTEDEDESDANNCSAPVQHSEQELRSSSPPLQTHDLQKHQIASSSLESLPSIPPENSTQKAETISKFQVGLKTGFATYPPISAVQVGQKVHLIGIVVEMSDPLTTRTGEWMRYINIIDPSNYVDEYTGYERIGLKVNVFSKKHKDWLPHPRIGDAVILRNVKIQQYQDHVTGSVLTSGLSWAAFSLDSGKIHFGPPSSAPKRDRITDSHYGAEICPFYDPKISEITYCVQLSDWWREVRPKDFVVADRQPSRPVELPTFGIQRVHRLIKDAHPDVQPNGYFDCTVELLSTYSGHNPQIHGLYVTDYTDNDGLRARSDYGQSLSQAVLQLEAWDAAANVARDMQPGQYYSIKNVRMKVAQSGYLEAKIVQDKITHLKGDLAKKNPHLQSLLERKKKRIMVPEIKHSLICDIEDGLPFFCVVEVLHVSEESGKVCIFVTDYTDREKLVGTAAGEPWAEGLQGKVMKIYLGDNQAHAGDVLVAGTFCRINNLILSNNPVYRCYCCVLDGSGRLIHKLSNSMTSNEHLNGVMRRKSTWEALARQGRATKAPKPKQEKTLPKEPSNPPSVSPSASNSKSLPPTASSHPTSKSKSSNIPTVSSPPKQTKPRLPYTLFKDVKLDDKPQRYQVYARVVDFHPTKLQNAFYQMCARCRKEVPSNRKACFQCLDTDLQYMQYHYQVYIKVQDEDGAELYASINDQSPFLQGLVRGDISADPECYTALVNRLTTIMDQMIDSSGRKKDNPEPGAFHLLELDSWVVPEGKRAFCLRRLINDSDPP